jgi:cytochrome c oxidase subunit 2
MQSAFEAASPQARMVAHLWWWMFAVGIVIWLGVAVLAIYSARASHGRRESDTLIHVDESTHHRMERVVSVGIFITGLVLVGFLVFDFSVGRLLAQHPQRALTIDVIGHQWWWEATYEDPNPSQRGATVNEIHVPVGEPIQFKLRSADVIHSFWVPSLSGKKDLIPGYVSTLWFQADTSGIYRGQCAEFCGLQHAKMALYIVAEPKPQFTACHQIAGTDARSTVGPDLTHFKSRGTIAAGTLANNRANLTQWIENPDRFKPGVRMPAMPLTAVERDALISYLETLK